jgi:hypothetical protein
LLALVIWMVCPVDHAFATEASTGQVEVAVVGTEFLTLARLPAPPVDCAAVPADRVVIYWQTGAERLVACLGGRWVPIAFPVAAPGG